MVGLCCGLVDHIDEVAAALMGEATPIPGARSVARQYLLATLIEQLERDMHGGGVPGRSSIGESSSFGQFTVAAVRAACQLAAWDYPIRYPQDARRVLPLAEQCVLTTLVEGGWTLMSLR